MISSDATLAGRTLLGAYTLHFEAPTNCTGSAIREVRNVAVKKNKS
jgi:hypothetical protein